MNNPDANEAAKRKSEIGVEKEEEEEGEISEYIRKNFEIGQERYPVSSFGSTGTSSSESSKRQSRPLLCPNIPPPTLTHLGQASKCTNKVCSCLKTTKRAAMDPPPPDPVAVAAVARAATIPHEILESQIITLHNKYNLRDNNNLYLNKKRPFEFLQSATAREGALFQKLRKAELDMFIVELNKTDLDLVAAKTAVTTTRQDLVRSQIDVARARAYLPNHRLH